MTQAIETTAVEREERRLVDGCRRGDFDCFERLMARYEKKIYNLALRMLRDPDDAREILQETFLKVYDNLEKFRGEAQMSTWIYRIAMNEALMRIRKDKHRPFAKYVASSLRRKTRAR